MSYPVTMICIWGNNDDNKTVTWYRQTNNVTQQIWRFVGTATHVTENEALGGKGDEFRAAAQKNFLHEHRLILLHAFDDDEGLYWCDVEIAGLNYQIEEQRKKSLDVIGINIFMSLYIILKCIVRCELKLEILINGQCKVKPAYRISTLQY